MDLPKLNELIDSLDEKDPDIAPVKSILLGLKGALCVNRQRSLFEHVIPWIRNDRERNLQEISREKASHN